MRCVNTKPVGTDPKTGKQLVEAMIIADTKTRKSAHHRRGHYRHERERGFRPVQPDLCAG